MAELIPEDNRLIVKIVYYGPALSGKTTNLMRLHDMLESRHCGELMTFETKGDRTLFFDLLPLVVRSESGFSVKLKLGKTTTLYALLRAGAKIYSRTKAPVAIAVAAAATRAGSASMRFS